MSDCFWLRKLTVRGFLIGCLIGFGLTLGQQDCRASYDKPQRQVAYEIADNHVRPPVYSGGSLRNLKPQNPCESTQDREDRDLCQQWRMAQAAESQASWTKAQFWITFAEVVGLVLVVFYTAKTARDAGRSAVAAEAIVNVSQKTAERQLRAYVHCDGIRFIDFDKPLVRVEIKVRNSGQTPAQSVSHTFVLKFGSGKDEPATPETFTKWDDTGELSPGSFIGTVIDIEKPALTEEKKSALLNGVATFYAIGAVKYVDVFGIERRTDFKFLFGGDAPTDGEYHFALCKTGNKAT